MRLLIPRSESGQSGTRLGQRRADRRVLSIDLFHKLRSLAIENLNQHFKGIFGGHGQVPTRGLGAQRRWALGGGLVYQFAFLFRHEQGLDLNVGLKPFLKAAG
jgi:hypothetical protein